MVSNYEQFAGGENRTEKNWSYLGEVPSPMAPWLSDDPEGTAPSVIVPINNRFLKDQIMGQIASSSHSNFVPVSTNLWDNFLLGCCVG
jgi:hypothetical protein